MPVTHTDTHADARGIDAVAMQEGTQRWSKRQTINIKQCK